MRKKRKTEKFPARILVTRPEHDEGLLAWDIDDHESFSDGEKVAVYALTQVKVGRVRRTLE
jgi:hypothetical protein